jgi:hypothetical protein
VHEWANKTEDSDKEFIIIINIIIGKTDLFEP